MEKLIKGLRHFQTDYFSKHQELFEQLAHGQHPRALFITCSDSRVDPNLITNAQVGELFVIRNAGNMIPPYGATNGGEGGAMEYAIAALGIEDIIVCGHSYCGAMKGLLKLDELEEKMPLVYDWLKQGEATRRLVKENYSTLQGDDLLDITVAENVLSQIENLRTYPIVHSRLRQGKLNLHAWVYHIENGAVYAYDAVRHAYVAPSSALQPMKPEDLIEHEPDDHPTPNWLSPEQANRIYRGTY
ncbi:carbonic anhydrase [Spirulina sp. CS-785/01]|uniref:carbonic anhydrase n=1 Tax=Spirulina sp. CS-785/01 TaxID=3021716 RepID=UPI00232DF8DF|nr:carbonic anhydrase [Spirulina sp. CS-785/01]MDB9313343.1 carbonic anhydrase [Spirulina sp. CS-785/01]